MGLRDESPLKGVPQPPATRAFTLTDLIVHAAILALGALQFLFYLRVNDFVNDATYYELARSIIDKRSYELFSFRPETMLPPGFPLILALVVLIAGAKTSAFYHVMAISATLGLSASYELLRRVEGRAVAAAGALLLASSPALFAFTTRLVFSDMPYFAVSMLTLLLAWNLAARQGRRPIVRMSLFCLLVIVLILIRSTGVAMLMALCAWMGISWLRHPRDRRRLRQFMIPLVLGATVQLAWMAWAGHRRFSEWPVPGYPGSYLSQLKLKSGNYPELGMATLRDIPARVINNVVIRATELSQLLTRAWINPKWCSPAIFGVLLLIFSGVASSLWKGGGQLYDWYFLFYESMFVFWPWEFEMRFLLPVVPLAFLYLWRGAKAIAQFSLRKPKIARLYFLLGGGFLAANSAVWNLHEKSIQSLGATVFWGVVAIVGAMMSRPRFETIAGRLFPALRVIASVGFCALVAYGCGMELHIARKNASFDVSTAPYYPDIEAARWIQTHGPPQAVVMARKEDLVYHYSRHPVVWFPPISNPEVLMKGIQKYRVGMIVVVDRREEYFMPTQRTCFKELSAIHGQDFHLVHQGPDNQVFEVNVTGKSTR